jgi:hypothetical protein
MKGMCDRREQIPLPQLLRKSRRVRDARLNVKFGCFASCPPESTISWTEVFFVAVYPRNAVFSWTGAARRWQAYLPAAVPRKSFLIFHYHPGICRFFRMSLPKLYVSSGKYAISPDSTMADGGHMHFHNEFTIK